MCTISARVDVPVPCAREGGSEELRTEVSGGGAPAPRGGAVRGRWRGWDVVGNFRPNAPFRSPPWDGS